MTTSRVIAYLRVSTAEQAQSGLGLAAQEQAVRAECERRGWELVDLVRDEGASGKSLDRPGVQSVLARLAAGEAEGLVVAKLDRLTRSLADLVHLLDWSDRVRVFLAALDLGLDTSTPSGRLVASVMASVGEWERSVIAQRTRDAASVRRERGERMGRAGVRDSAPQVAERIARLRAAGSTWQAIADGLNADGVPTVRGGSAWRVSAVQSAAGYVRPASRARRVELPEPSRRRRATAAA